MNEKQTTKQIAAALAQRSRDLDTIKNAVAFAFETFPSQLYGACRKHELVVPRQVAMYLGRAMTTASFPELAAVFNKRNHATIMYGCRIVQERMQRDRAFRERLESLRTIIAAGLEKGFRKAS